MQIAGFLVQGLNCCLLFFYFNHYENLPMQYTEIFFSCKNCKFSVDFFCYFSYCCSKHRLWVHVSEAVLTSTHNLCVGAKIRKIGIPLHTPVLLYKSGVYGGIHYTDMFS